MSYTLFHRTFGPLDPQGFNGEILIQHYNDTNDEGTRDLAIEEFIPLVDHILQKIFLPPENAITREDLRQSGLKGLVIAFNRFDMNKEIKFSTFAYKHIYGAMIDCLRQVRILPRNVFDRTAELSRLIEELSQELGQEPEGFEICDALNITPEELSNTLSDMSLTLPTFSLNSTVTGEDGASYLDLMEDREAYSPEEIFFIKEADKKIHRFLREGIQRLSSREQLIISLYYYEKLTLDEVGQILLLSEARISQIIKKVQTKLRVGSRPTFNYEVN